MKPPTPSAELEENKQSLHHEHHLSTKNLKSMLLIPRMKRGDCELELVGGEESLQQLWDQGDLEMLRETDEAEWSGGRRVPNGDGLLEPDKGAT